jgi:hypothetical protein
MDEVQTLKDVCKKLLAGDVRAGASLLNKHVPFVEVARKQRKYSKNTER